MSQVAQDIFLGGEPLGSREDPYTCLLLDRTPLGFRVRPGLQPLQGPPPDSVPSLGLSTALADR